VLRALAQGSKVRIEPIYVHSAGLMRMPAEVFKSPLSDLRPAIEKNLRDWLSSLDLPGLLPLTLLEQQDLSVRSKVLGMKHPNWAICSPYHFSNIAADKNRREFP